MPHEVARGPPQSLPPVQARVYLREAGLRGEGGRRVGGRSRQGPKFARFPADRERQHRPVPSLSVVRRRKAASFAAILPLFSFQTDRRDSRLLGAEKL